MSTKKAKQEKMAAPCTVSDVVDMPKTSDLSPELDPKNDKGQSAKTKKTKGSKRAGRSKTRREEIIAVARELYEENGLSRTSVQDITSRVGVTRSLFYHYFSDKDAVTSAVLDNMIDDYIEALSYWNEGRSVGQIDDALYSVIKLLRAVLFEEDSLHKALTSNENAALYLDFVNRVAHHTATFIIDTTVQDYAKLHDIRIEHLYETFYVLILGVIGYLRTHPEASDAVVADVIAQTLYLDRNES